MNKVILGQGWLVETCDVVGRCVSGMLQSSQNLTSNPLPLHIYRNSFHLCAPSYDSTAGMSLRSGGNRFHPNNTRNITTQDSKNMNSTRLGWAQHQKPKCETFQRMQKLFSIGKFFPLLFPPTHSLTAPTPPEPGALVWQCFFWLKVEIAKANPNRIWERNFLLHCCLPKNISM